MDALTEARSVGPEFVEWVTKMALLFVAARKQQGLEWQPSPVRMEVGSGTAGSGRYGMSVDYGVVGGERVETTQWYETAADRTANGVEAVRRHGGMLGCRLIERG